MNATMSLEKTKHYPVMLNQVLSIISPQHGGTFIDCTFGGGGYSHAILKYADTKVFAIDRDKLTQQYANTLVKKFPKRFNFSSFTIFLSINLWFCSFIFFTKIAPDLSLSIVRVSVTVKIAIFTFIKILG